MSYHKSVDTIKIYPLCHSQSFHPSLLLFPFDWQMKRWEITKVVSINCNGFHLLGHASGQMHVNIIISEPAVKIIMLILPCTQWNHKLQVMVTSCTVCVFGLLFVNTASIKIIIKHVATMLDCFWASDSSHKLWDSNKWSQLLLHVEIIVNNN